MRTTTIYYDLTASEFDWKISDKKTVKAWGFNNQLPGPVLRGKKGNTLVITLKNDLDEPTMIHWHGIRLPASMNGSGKVQRPVQPGEEFEYRFVVPEAGTFWYHLHHNETVQMEREMYGALIVEDDTDPIVDADRVFMIDDMKLTAGKQFKKEGFFARWIERREGETLLINGLEDPMISVHAGQMESWRFINSSSVASAIRRVFGKLLKTK